MGERLECFADLFERQSDALGHVNARHRTSVLASAVAVNQDTHRVKYTVACLEAKADDPAAADPSIWPRPPPQCLEARPEDHDLA